MHVNELIAGHDDNGLAIVHGTNRRTWAELRASIGQVTGRLAERTSPGDVVVVLGDTSIAFVEVVLGALSAGATVLPLSPRDPHAELERACALARPDVVVSVGADAAASALAPSFVGTDALMTGEAGAPVGVDPDAVGLLLFTSGTAGRPRLAMLSRNNIDASIRSTLRSSDRLPELARVISGVMPLTHVLGIVSVLGVSLALGSTLVLPDDPAPAAVADDVHRHESTLLVAPVFWFRLAESDVDASLLSSVRLALSGAAPLAGSLARHVRERFGFDLRQGYGLTEASPGLTSSVGTAAPATSVGRPLPDVELRLVDEFGDDALIGDVGEVWARGPNVFLGYLDDAAATTQVLDDEGWLHTGDLAVVDEQGFLYIVGRSKDQIISGGFNVHPGEVEDHLVAHPSVEAAAVVGEPDREYGEVVLAFVVPVGETPDVAELKAHCRQRLAGYKVPRRIEFVDELPRSTTGKLRRRALRHT